MKKDRQDVYVAQICAYIDEHLTEDLSYKRLQEQLQVTQHQLTGKFPQVVGFTLTNYVIKKRLKLVISKVRTGMRIEEAVYSSGFHTYSHFYKEFRKNYNCSPRVYFSKKR